MNLKVKVVSLFGIILILIGLLILATGCKSETEKPTEIFVNQVGNLNNAAKKAILKSYSGNFKVIDVQTDKEVLKGKSTPLSFWNHSGEQYATADFSKLNESGVYKLILDNHSASYDIIINQKFPVDLYKTAMRSFYLNRASTPIEEQYGGKYARAAGHPDDKIIVHETAADNSRKTGEVFSSPGGWYDAGDYGKYIVNSSITVYTLLNAFDQHASTLEQIDFNIPESGNGIPDILDETLYNVKWMLTMQDKDGGVYHKLTTETFEDFVMPEDAVKPRYVVMKTTPAALDFAASMAVCSRVVSQVEGLEEIATDCKTAAEKAWQWAMKNPDTFYKQPEGFNTGEYNDTNLTDEWFWASTELFLTTGEAAYFDEEYFSNVKFPVCTPSWDVVYTLGLMSTIANPEKFEKSYLEKVSKLYFDYVDELYNIYKSSPVLTSLDYFKWGSNSDVANQSMLAFLAYKLTGKDKYSEMGTANVDYILGRNPTGYCFVSGYGDKTPLNIHHRPSSADGIPEPIPGLLIGGPNTIVLNDCGEEVQRSAFPALSYTDSECSYSTNENAINWTAPLVYALSAMIEMEE